MKLLNEEHQQFSKLFSDLTRPKTVRDVNETNNIISQVDQQLERERDERKSLRQEDLQIARDAKKEEREKLYDFQLAQDKEQHTRMKKSIFSFFMQLEDMAKTGEPMDVEKLEKLVEPVVLPQPTHASKELVMRKKEAKVATMHAQTKPVNETAYEEKVSVYKEKKVAEQKVKLDQKRIELQAAAGVPIIDPEKVDDLERMVASIPRIDPAKLDNLEEMIRNKPSVDPSQITALENVIKKMEADSLARHEMMQ